MEAKKKNKGGRPKKIVSKTDFEKLCAFQCTKLEICGHLVLDDVTLEKWCKETYKKGFSEVFKEKRTIGKLSLRRAGFQMAQTNPAVWIFHAKNFLGMADNPHQPNELKPMPITDYRESKSTNTESN